jgi:hypothetical protein
MIEVRMHVEGYPDSDDEERANLAWRLEEELRGLDVEEISRPPAAAPEGAKGGALEWAQIVLGIAGTLPPLITAVLAWARRHPGAEVMVEIDGDRLTLNDASADERRALVEAWLERHAAAA